MPPQQKETTNLIMNSDEDDFNEPENTYLSLEQLGAAPDPGIRLRTSEMRRPTFIQQFVKSKGPPQIFGLMLVLAIALGSTIGVIPAVMTDRYARLNHGYSDEHNCNEFTIHNKPQECLNGSADAQNAVACSTFVNDGFKFITGALIGSLSDQYGRKPFLIVGVFLSALSPLCLVLLQLIPTMSPTWYYVLGAFQGLFSWMTVAMSSLADVMPPKWRAASFGVLLAGFSLGLCLAPQLSLAFSHLGVSIFSAFMMFSVWFAVIFFLPETLSLEAKLEAQIAFDEEIEALDGSSKILFYLVRPIREISILNRDYLFRILSLLAFFSGIVLSADQTLLIYYLEERLDFHDKDVANIFVIYGLFGICVQGFILKPLNGLVGEKMVIIIAFLCGTLNNALYGLAKTKSAVFVAVAISTFTGMAFPTISAIKANNVEKSEQGRIQGALFSVQALAAAIGPLLLRFVYHNTKNSTFPGPGGMFLFASGIFLIAVFFACILPRDRVVSKRDTSNETSQPTEDEERTALQRSATDSTIEI